MICSLPIVLPCAWGVFQPQERFEYLLPRWAILVAGVTFVEFALTIPSVKPFNKHLEYFVTLLALNFSQCVTVAGAMFLMKRFGYQLIRRNTQWPSTANH